jgi:hypothetical protein
MSVYGRLLESSESDGKFGPLSGELQSSSILRTTGRNFQMSFSYGNLPDRDKIDGPCIER